MIFDYLKKFVVLFFKKESLLILHKIEGSMTSCFLFLWVATGNGLAGQVETQV